MEKKFWLDKWEANEIGFHLSDYHPLLQKFYPMLYADKKSVFVPLCGKSRDMAFLESKGLAVTGCELSGKAAEDFFTELYPLAQQSVEAVKGSRFNRYHKNDINILVGNIFDLEPSDFTGIEFIYDRASIVALPDKLRQQYVSHLCQIFPTVKMLLITLDYDQKIMNGPPFSVTQKEVNKLFSFAKVKQLHRSDIIEQEPAFKKRGLTRFYETVYSIEW